MDEFEKLYRDRALKQLERKYRIFNAVKMVHAMGLCWFVAGMGLLLETLFSACPTLDPTHSADFSGMLNALFLGKRWISFLFACFFLARAAFALFHPKKYFFCFWGLSSAFPDQYLKYGLPLFGLSGFLWLFNFPMPNLLYYMTLYNGVITILTLKWWWFVRKDHLPQQIRNDVNIHSGPEASELNPSTGLPMAGGTDIGGHSFGSSD